MRIDLPAFKILVLAPFSPALETNNPPLIKADPSSMDQALADLRPCLDIPVKREILPDGNINICIGKMADFRPRNISKNPAFKQLAATISSGTPPSPSQSESPLDVLDDLLSMVDTDKASSPSASPLSTGKNRLLQAVFAEERFRKLEASWRGLQLLARQIPSGSQTTVEFKLIPISKSNLLPVLERLQNQLSDSPPDLILLDRPLSNSPRSMEELEKLMDFAETMLAPTMVEFSPQFFELGNWSEADKLPFIPALLEGAEYGRWKTLRERSGAGWIIPCAGKIMGRTLHTQEQGYEDSSLNEAEPLWINSIWSAAALCAKSLAEYGRATLFADHSSVRLEGMPLTPGSNPAPLTPQLTTERVKDFRQAGINSSAFIGDRVFLLGAVTMDGGPANLRFYLSRLIHFLIQLSTEKRKELNDLVPQLTEAISLFLQQQGYTPPQDLSIKKGEPSAETVPLEISVTPGSEILPGSAPLVFGFNW